jgi:negative regulator of replication initiation
MMPVIRVDDDVFSVLQRSAEPLVDTPNTVLRRLLGLSENKKGALQAVPRTPPQGDRTPQRAFRVPILRALSELGGQAETRVVLRMVEERLGQLLTPTDRQTLKDRRVARWQNLAEWERKKMVGDGLLASDSPRGIWRMTEGGRQYLARHQGD